MRVYGMIFWCVAALLCAVLAVAAPPKIDDGVTQGALRVARGDTLVECPLKHTDVQGAISGFLANVTVTQTFVNPYDEKIEAVYVFPLPHTAAVTAMTMYVGDRNIVGLIKRRAEARFIYEQALEAGQTTALLEQERPNIFTQSVGNIKPKSAVKVVITYTDVLKYDMGTYEFHFPMVVGPRYNAGAPFTGTPGKGRGAAPNGVNPPVLKPGFRNGHDISLSLSLNAGVPVHGLVIPNHRAAVQRVGETRATVKLDPADSIPNKDFVFRYTVVGNQPALAVLAHNDASETGYFMLMIQPKLDEALAKAPPREVIFLVDVSGSMSGEPTAKNKALLREFFTRMRPADTFNVVTFASQATRLFNKAVPVSEENTKQAFAFIDQMEAGGGTEMLKGINMVLDDPLDGQRVRICVMMTDGYIGNEAEIIAAVGKKAGDQIKFWTLGIGSSPNRFLIDGVAKQGGGASAVVELKTDPAPLVGEIMERIHRAQLAHIAIDWNGLPVEQIFPRRIPELWAGRPVILFGRYNDGGATRITINGTAEGIPMSYDLDVVLPANSDPANAVLAPVWARKKIEDLSEQMLYGDNPDIIEEITQTALQYRLMSQYTSFVAVDADDDDVMSRVLSRPRRVDVAVPLPEGVSFDGIFGTDGVADGKETTYKRAATASMKPAPSPAHGASAGLVGLNSLLVRTDSGELINTQGPLIRLPSSRPVPRAIAPKPGWAGRGSAAPPPPPPVVKKQFDFAGEDKSGVAARGVKPNFFTANAQRSHDDAVAALGKASLTSDTKEAFYRAQQSFLLMSMAGRLGYADVRMLADAQDIQQRSGARLTKDAVAALPALKGKLNLVIRNKRIADAVATLAKASGVTMRLQPGCVDDVTAFLNGVEPRAAFLDLRGATITEALDCLLTPAHLTWRVQKGTVLVGVARRMSGDAVWTYQVGDLARPLNAQDPLAEFAKFQAAVRLVLGQAKDGCLAPGSVALLDPAHLVAFGDPVFHGKVARVLTALTAGTPDIATLATGLKADDAKRLRAVQAQTAARWAARKGERAARVVTAQRDTVRRALLLQAWALLASAAKGETNLEALTALQAAWASPYLPDLLTETTLPVPRAAWAIAEAAARLPKDTELQALNIAARKTLLAALPGQLKTQGDPAWFSLALLYEARALPLGDDLQAQIVPRLVGLPADNAVGVVARALLKPSAEHDVALVAALNAQRIRGDDLFVLTALAAQARGGALWQAWYEGLPDLTGHQRLNGNAVLFANRLKAASR
jgi:Ca-activated chloride channel family protein